MRLSRSGYLIREGFRSIGTHRFMSFASVTIIMACLIIIGSVSLLTMNINSVIHSLEDQNEIVAYIDETWSEDEARAVGPKLEAIDNVASVEFIDRATAMETFLNNYSSTLREGLDETVFRHRFVIQLEDIALMATTEARLRSVEGVANVIAHLDYAKAFVTVRNVVSVISLVLIIVLVFISLFIMTNTIKLATFNRREEIAIMKMVGANNGFIRLPFIIEGLTLGLMGGVLAFAAVIGLYHLVVSRLAATLAGSFFTVVPISAVALPLLIGFGIASVLVGVFGATNAIRNYLQV